MKTKELLELLPEKMENAKIGSFQAGWNEAIDITKLKIENEH